MIPSTDQLYGLIVAGGSGTRLWPLSRANEPKQLLAIDGEGPSLLQTTFRRLTRSVPAGRVFTVTSRAYEGRVLGQLREFDPDHPASNVLGEPAGKNSAAAILWGALRIAAECPTALIAVVWSDHRIGDEARFGQYLGRAIEAAQQGRLVALGVKPTRPETGFGYIEAGAERAPGVFAVERFVEKPSPRAAGEFLAQERFTWNAGMFVFPVQTLLGEYHALAPELERAFVGEPKGTRNGKGAAGWSDPETMDAVYRDLPSASIDRLILEKTRQLDVIPCELDWCDLGSWDVVYANAGKDRAGNAITGNVAALDTRNSLIRGQRRLIATVGVEGLIVVDTEDALLICDMRRVQDVKALVATLTSRNLPEATESPTSHRPWGTYTIVNKGPGWQVKVIEVLPHRKMSLQMHRQRDEHWIVIEGTAAIVLDGEERTMRVHDHALIRKEVKHRIGNPTGEALRIIELQQGPYLGEDDIVRFEDDFGRA